MAKVFTRTFLRTLVASLPVFLLVCAAVLAFVAADGLKAQRARADAAETTARQCQEATVAADRLRDAYAEWGELAIVDRDSATQHVDLERLADRAEIVNLTNDAYEAARAACLAQ